MCRFTCVRIFILHSKKSSVIQSAASFNSYLCKANEAENITKKKAAAKPPTPLTAPVQTDGVC